MYSPIIDEINEPFVTAWLLFTYSVCYLLLITEKLNTDHCFTFSLVYSVSLQPIRKSQNV